jgi:hypothetical protein
MPRNPKLNAEGYADPTAYEALKPIVEMENDVAILIKVLKYIIRKSGFELAARIEIRDPKSGRIFK